jgi:hypothetical protein
MPADPAQPQPDFATDLFIAEKPGAEFVGMRRSRILAPTIGGMMFLPAIGCSALLYLGLVGIAGVPRVAAAVVCVVCAAAALTMLIAYNARGGTAGWSGFGSMRPSDSRFRLRVVIPRSRQTRGMARWAMLATGLQPDEYPADTEELAAVRGGFEPIIIRPWLGIQRGKHYHCTVGVAAALSLALVVAFGLATTGSLQPLFQSFRMWGVFGLVTAASLGTAEFLFPTYLRLAPGRLDIFHYRLLGRGEPIVTTYDLKSVPLCVDFQSATIVIEPPRPPGVPLPPTVLSSRWPHWKEYPPSYRPEYLSLSLCQGRTEFCQRLIQAARTNEPTPPLPSDRLLG